MKTYSWEFLNNGKIALYQGSVKILEAHSEARTLDGRKIDTREAVLVEKNKDSAVYRTENGLILTQKVIGGEYAEAKCILSDASGADISSRYLAPLCMYGGGGVTETLFDGLFSKMLLVPYDNTMWLRYEAVPMRAGRKSYDFSVLFLEDTREALLMGAVDFTVWKNAVVCASRESRQLQAVSGSADAGTHDEVPHGAISGKYVESAPFLVAYGSDYQELLEMYGDYLHTRNPILEWKGGVPFGFNSWAGLAFNLNAENFRRTGKLFREELLLNSYNNEGEQYINFDACWQNIDPNIRRDLVEELHAGGQHAGIYDAPFACFTDDIDAEIPLVPGHTYREILLCDDDGQLIERVDGAHPFDVTHPVWKEMEEKKVEYFREMKFDYVKLDFMSHGAAEGKHYDPAVSTGRQAMTLACHYLDDLMSEEAMGRPFFISISIAPLFPNGYAHARRISCDAFGKNEDVEYVLNTQTWGWWINRRLYCYNDPDHICLLKGYFDHRETTVNEARARYTTAVIGGTVMMLSDDYQNEEAVRRTILLAENAEVNRIAASGIAFRPLSGNGTSACHCFTAKIEGNNYIALFAWKPGVQTISAPATAGSHWQDLWTGDIYNAEDGFINWTIDGCDALLLKQV